MGTDEDRLVGRALDALDDVFYVYDEQGELVHWNRALEEVFRHLDGDFTGMTAPEFFVPADQSKVERAVTEVLETGSTVVEARADTARGPMLFELTGRLLTDEEGNAVGFAGIGRDVTETREREWQLERQNERLAEFSDVLTHDLRNPLQVAISHLELARSRADTAELVTVAGALNRLQEIIHDVLLVAREGQAVIEREPVDLGRVARAAWEQVETEAATLVVDTTQRVDGDAERLGRLFENVYRNAVDHAGRDVVVTVRDTETGFAIEDDGPGFPTANRDRLFDPGVSQSADGTGFGLNIVRTLAEAHGWTVRAGDAETGGARLAFDMDAVTNGAANLGSGGEMESDGGT